MGPVRAAKALHAVNQVKGFDWPGLRLSGTGEAKPRRVL
ncbi:MAG: hypothetical protein JWN05_1439 [Arthrobacter sp.]|jgi:hypothetical protein|nr:hypothetical protein [Arthrobacter sp.]